MKGILLTPMLLKGAPNHLGHMRGSVKGELIPVTDANPVERFSLSQVNPVSNTLIRHSPFSLGARGIPLQISFLIPRQTLHAPYPSLMSALDLLRYEVEAAQLTRRRDTFNPGYPSYNHSPPPLSIPTRQGYEEPVQDSRHPSDQSWADGNGDQPSPNTPCSARSAGNGSFGELMASSAVSSNASHSVRPSSFDLSFVNKLLDSSTASDIAHLHPIAGLFFDAANFARRSLPLCSPGSELYEAGSYHGRMSDCPSGGGSGNFPANSIRHSLSEYGSSDTSRYSYYR